MDFIALLLSVHGRIGRASYWLGTLILAAVSIVVVGIAIALEGISDEAVVASMAAGLAIAYPTYALMAKRFQDRGKPGITALFGLVPIYGINLLQTFGVIDPFDPTPLYHVLNYAVIGLSLWLLIDVGFLKGTQGPNRYGPDPLETKVDPPPDTRLRLCTTLIPFRKAGVRPYKRPGRLEERPQREGER